MHRSAIKVLLPTFAWCCALSGLLLAQVQLPLTQLPAPDVNQNCLDYRDPGVFECPPPNNPIDRLNPVKRIAGLPAATAVPEAEPERTPRLQPEYRVTEPPTEFQRFIQSSSGQMLPIYGAWLFERIPSTFAPLDQVPVKQDYTLGPGDQIDVQVWGQINFSQLLTIDRSGNVFLPQVGRISLAALPFGQVQDAVRSAIGRVYKNFEVNVNMGRLRSIQIFIVGQARRPGTYTVSSLSTLVNALFASGGPSSRGSMRGIQLKRNDKLITTFDLYDLLLRGDKSKDVSLQAGDVIFIPSAGPRVAILGTVELPAIYEIGNNTPLREVLTDAGGLSSVAAGRRAILERINQHSALRSEDVELDAEGLSKTLLDGDIVRLLPIVPHFENTITLRGNVADPVRLPWRPGMRVSDAIPDKQALLTRNYWSERNRLQAERHPEGSATDPLATFVSTSKTYREQPRNAASDKSLAAAVTNQESAPVRYFNLKNDVQPPAPDINWNFASIERIDQANLTTRLISFNLGKVVITHDPAADVVLEPGDVITIFSHADIETPKIEQTKLVRLEGEVNMAGVYSALPGETLRELVGRAGGLSPKAYLYGAEFTRESVRREQQKRYSDFLDEMDRDIQQSVATVNSRALSPAEGAGAIAGKEMLVDRLRQTSASGRIVFDLEPGSRGTEALPEIQLENGDRLFVPGIPSTVNVVGTVYNQSSFLIGPDQRLGDYLRQAGGVTPYADKGHIFVIRANGSIIAREARSAAFTARFDTLRMYPGDTVVVPTNVTRISKLRGFVEWSQVFSGFGLAAAAVNVLR